MSNHYAKADKMLELFNKQLAKKISNYKPRLLSNDELTVLHSTREMYKEIKTDIKTYLKQIAKGEDLDELEIEELLYLLLEEINEVTKYSFTKELERKTDRFAEEVFISKEKELAILKFLKYISYMFKYYSVLLTDSVHIKVLEKQETEKVKWLTESDSKVCPICKERNGKVYPLAKVPPKPHINCRCWLEKA